MCNLKDKSIPMICLSFLLPGKVGKFARKFLFPIVAVGIVYMLVWAFILKSISFESVELIPKGKYMYAVFKIKNDAFAGVEIVDLNVKNTRGQSVRKRSSDLPMTIPRYSRRSVKVRYDLEEYESIDVTLKALLTKHKENSPLNKVK